MYLIHYSTSFMIQKKIVHSLKLTYPLKIGLPNRTFHLPDHHFQVPCLSSRGVSPPELLCQNPGASIFFSRISSWVSAFQVGPS